MAKKVSYDYPYRLRLLHGDRAELRLERAGRPIVFDPVAEIGEDDVVVLTGSSPDRSVAVSEAARAGRRPTVLAAPELLAWLATQGPIEAVAAPATIDDVAFAGLAFEAPTPRGTRPSLRSSALSPSVALRALRGGARSTGPRAGGAPVAPMAWQLTFPDGSRLVHLDVALHAATPEAWVDRAVEAFGASEWVVVGAAYGESAGVERLLPRFGATRILLAELVNGERRAVGLPTELVTPLRDRLHAAGMETHVFATQTSFRFE